MAQNKRSTHPLDRKIGLRLRQARLRAGLTQNALAHCLGISFQQIQKYEKGLNRIPASRLIDLAPVLGVPPASLLPDAVATPPPNYDRSEHRAARIARNIEDPIIRRRWLDLGQSLAAKTQDEVLVSSPDG
ncbi:MAG: helix-turn-helix transcriptional regulator [Planctomycetota bacterium]